MKKHLITPLLLIMVWFAGSGFTAVSGGQEAKVTIDGQEIRPEGELKFKRDDTVYLEATGIKPNSLIEVKVRKAGIAWLNHEFRVDEEGKVTGILHMPEQKLKVTCFVAYTAADGSGHDVKFKFKTY